MAERLKGELPPATAEAMRRHEATGELDHPDDERATMEFYRRHLCRLPTWPDCLLRTARGVAGNQVYATMNGPNEFTVIGNLKDWERRDRLGEITVPTLITVGRYDEVTPACSETMRQAIPGAELVVFEESSHTAHLEETDRYLQIVGDVMRRSEA